MFTPPLGDSDSFPYEGAIPVEMGDAKCDVTSNPAQWSKDATKVTWTLCRDECNTRALSTIADTTLPGRPQYTNVTGCVGFSFDVSVNECWLNHDLSSMISKMPNAPNDGSKCFTYTTAGRDIQTIQSRLSGFYTTYSAAGGKLTTDMYTQIEYYAELEKAYYEITLERNYWKTLYDKIADPAFIPSVQAKVLQSINSKLTVLNEAEDPTSNTNIVGATKQYDDADSALLEAQSALIVL